MAEKICPLTGRTCLAKCPTHLDYCYIGRVVPVVQRETRRFINQEALGFSKLERLLPAERIELAKEISEQAKKGL